MLDTLILQPVRILHRFLNGEKEYTERIFGVFFLSFCVLYLQIEVFCVQTMLFSECTTPLWS